MTRFFSRDGAPAGDFEQISDAETHSGASPLIRALPYGSFAVVWINTPDLVTNDVHIREVDPVTGGLGPRVPILRNASLFGYGFEVNAHGQGVVLVGNRVRLVQFVPDDNSSTPEAGE